MVTPNSEVGTDTARIERSPRVLANAVLGGQNGNQRHHGNGDREAVIAICDATDATAIGRSGRIPFSGRYRQ